MSVTDRLPLLPACFMHVTGGAWLHGFQFCVIAAGRGPQWLKATPNAEVGISLFAAIEILQKL